MNRRRLLSCAGAATIVWSASALAQSDALAALLAEVASDPSLVERAWQYRERSVSRGVGHGTPSRRKLSQAAIDLIIAFEIASPAAYEARYRRPIWPKGASGVTIGVGYDLRFANKAYIDRDWPMLSQADRNLLYTVVRIAGIDAKRALPSVQSVDIAWAPAKTQFLAFLPYPTKQTEDAFPNCDKLHDDCFGALVSLVYNRGPQISKNSQSRREMYQIQQFMKSNQFTGIPDQIRLMKRLWENNPDARGLLKRREAEALLFEQGLRSA